MQHQPHHLHHRTRAPSSHHRLALNVDNTMWSSSQDRDEEKKKKRKKRSQKRAPQQQQQQRSIIDSTNHRSADSIARAIRIRSASRRAIRVDRRSETERGSSVWIGNSSPRVEGKKEKIRRVGEGMGREKGPGEFAPPAGWLLRTTAPVTHPRFKKKRRWKIRTTRELEQILSKEEI